MILAFPRERKDSPALVFGNELIVWSSDAQVFEQLLLRVAAARRSSPLRPTITRRIPGRAIALVRAEGEGIHTPGEILASLGIPAPLARSIRAAPNGVLHMESNQDLLDPQSPGQQWPLDNPGKFGASPTRPDADADGADAVVRMRSMGPVATRDIVVGVLDTGIDAGHEALGPALWTNPKEIPGNGVDDDQNGYVDDVHGWNFADDNADLRDWNGHGTHVSGIIAARRPLQPGRGMWGIAPFSKILTARLPLSTTSLTSAFVAASAVYYARDQGVDVMNMSFGSDVLNVPFRDAIWSVAGQIHVVAAAGNTADDLAQKPAYPCSIGTVICVLSTTMFDTLAASSSYDTRAPWMPGGPFLFIAAPGDQVFSTVPTHLGTYGLKGGTSMASPLVAGTLAAIESMHPTESTAEHRMRLFGNADRVERLATRVDEGRRLNVYHAVFSPPVGISKFDQTSYCSASIVISPHPGPVARWNNRPYANSGEPGIDGTPTGPFTLCTIEQLTGIRNQDLDKVFELRQHIHWKPGQNSIGGAAGQSPLPFNGVLRGNGYSIFNLKIAGRPAAGLIAHLGPRGEVWNLHLRSVDVRSTSSAGAVTALSEGLVSNVHVDGRVEGNWSVGGLIGEMRQGVVTRGYFSGEVVGARYVGGVAGMMGLSPTALDATITFSQARGVVRGDFAGGIAGQVQFRGRIRSSHAWIYAPASGYIVGGIAGLVRCGARVENSYAEGSFGSAAPAGAVVGQLNDAQVLKSYGSLFFSSPGTDRGGAVGKVMDRVVTSTGGPAVYVCTGTNQAPDTSKTAEIFYDSFLSSGSGARGTPLSPSALRRRTSFPAGWFAPPGTWHYENGFMPLLTGLPRSF